MVFSSLTYLLLFMPCVLLGYRLMPSKARMPFLLGASLLFYGWGSPAWLLLLAWCILVSWGGVLLMSRFQSKRKLILILIIVLDLLPLFWFKYIGFIRDTVRDVTGWSLDIRNPVLPAGISFFTFQALSYVIDVYRGNARTQRSPVTFGVYLALFPQLVAGPIVRYTDLEEQLIAHPRPTWEQMRRGLRRFCVGLAKKVLLADALGRFWGQMNADFTQAGALGAWLGLIAFSFQIYFDFSGYSDMAIGLGSPGRQSPRHAAAGPEPADRLVSDGSVAWCRLEFCTLGTFLRSASDPGKTVYQGQFPAGAYTGLAAPVFHLYSGSSRLGTVLRLRHAAVQRHVRQRRFCFFPVTPDLRCLRSVAAPVRVHFLCSAPSQGAGMAVCRSRPDASLPRRARFPGLCALCLFPVLMKGGRPHERKA